MDTGAMPHRFLKSRWVTIGVTVVVIGAWGWVLAQQMQALYEYPWDIAPLALLASLIAGMLYFRGLAWSWALLLDTIAGPSRHVSRGLASTIWLLSMMTRYIPGNIWHIVGRMAFAERLHVTKTQIVSSSTIEQLLAILGALVVFVGTLPLWSVLPEAQLGLSWLLPLGLLFIHPQLMGRLLHWGAHRFRRPELAWNYTFGEMLRLLTVFAVANLFSGVALCALLSGLTPVAASDWPFVIGSACLAWAVGYLSFLTPSGLGVREAALTALLVLVYPMPVAVVASLLFRVALTLGEALAALSAWVTNKM